MGAMAEKTIDTSGSLSNSDVIGVINARRKQNLCIGESDSIDIEDEEPLETLLNWESRGMS